MEIHPVKKLVDHYERIDDPEYNPKLYIRSPWTWRLGYEFPWRCDVASLIDAFEFYKDVPRTESTNDILDYATDLYHEKVYGSSDDEW